MWGGLSLITMNVHCMSLQRRVPATSLSVIVPSPELASYNSLITCLRNRTTKLYFLCLSGSRFLQVWELGWDHCRNSRITAPLLPPLGASPVGFRGFPSVVLDLIGWCCQVWDVKIPGASCTIERFNTRWLSCLWAAALQTGRTLFINICWLISCNSITSVKRWSWELHPETTRSKRFCSFCWTSFVSLAWREEHHSVMFECGVPAPCDFQLHPLDSLSFPDLIWSPNPLLVTAAQCNLMPHFLPLFSLPLQVCGLSCWFARCFCNKQRRFLIHMWLFRAGIKCGGLPAPIVPALLYWQVQKEFVRDY